jgi:hypothetical protein
MFDMVENAAEAAQGAGEFPVQWQELIGYSDACNTRYCDDHAKYSAALTSGGVSSFAHINTRHALPPAISLPGFLGDSLFREVFQTIS